eukprot:PITA_33852
MMEGLGKVIISAKREGTIEGLKLTQDRDSLTHQQFVDDTMLQGIPTVKEAKAYKQILRDFSLAASIERDHLPSKYLGIPLTDKPLSKEVWELLTNKLKDKISKWTSRSLNLASRLVFTKAVLQSIPIYMFSALPVPRGVAQQIRNMQRDFLWGKGEEKGKWALLAWDKLCKPKLHGGLGLHDPATLKNVLGEKLWWRWLKKSSNPWAKL